ncbi:MAG TPA: hypothetical protein VIT24_08305, partial [Acidimicrobiales bacterium]
MAETRAGEAIGHRLEVAGGHVLLVAGYERVVETHAIREAVSDGHHGDRRTAPPYGPPASSSCPSSDDLGLAVAVIPETAHEQVTFC